MKEENMFLGVDLTKLPDEVRSKMTAASASYKRYQRANEQLILWNKEKDNAALTLTAAQSDWQECLNRWDPDSNSLKPALEAAPREQSS